MISVLDFSNRCTHTYMRIEDLVPDTYVRLPPTAEHVLDGIESNFLQETVGLEEKGGWIEMARVASESAVQGAACGGAGLHMGMTSQGLYSVCKSIPPKGTSAHYNNHSKL